MTWPPPRVPDPHLPPRPWDPGDPEEKDLANEHERLLYVVVDEIVEEWVGLSVSLWPHADGRGRLRFTDPGGVVGLGTSRAALDRLFHSKRRDTPEPRIGLTFAVRVKRGTAASVLDELRERAGPGHARVDDLRELFKDPVDLSEQGRLLAKLACYGAMLATLPARLEQDWKLEKEAET